MDGVREDDSPAADKKSKRDWCLGILFILLVCGLWALGSVMVQHVAADIGYNKPFVFTYIGSCAVSSCLPVYMAFSLAGVAPNPPFRSEEDGAPLYRELEEVDGPDAENEVEARSQLAPHLLGHAGSDGSGPALAPAIVAINGDSREPAKPSLKSHLFMLKIGLSLCVVWFMAQWAYVGSLGYTSVTSSTIISNSSALFTFVFGVMAKTERFTPGKAAGVALALLGAAAVGLGDREESDSADSLWGDVSALAAAVLYGVYSTILRLRAPSDDDVSMTLVLGYMGIANVIIFLPLLLLLALLPGVRILDGLTLPIIQLLLAKAFLDNVMSELLWARSILLTTPTVATVGCSLTIPIAFTTDFLLHRKVPNALSVTGAFMVVAAFLFVSGRESSPVTDSPTTMAGSGPGCCSSAIEFSSLFRRKMRVAESESSASSCSETDGGGASLQKRHT